jgi:DNA polymerase III epsilon subunit-like protein
MLANLSKKNYPVLTPVPPGINYALIFDVETTGLLPKSDPYTKILPPIESYPHIIQFSWVLYNMKTNMFDEVKNYVIKVPEEVAITKEITDLTSITKEMCNAGHDLGGVLLQFCELYENADMVVAHNIQFDATMVSVEMMRHRTFLEKRLGKDLALNIFSDEYTSEHKIDLYCTMMASKEICNIWAEYTPKSYVIPPTPTPQPTTSISSSCELFIIPQKPASPPRITNPSSSMPKKYKKFPKLSELHNHLFGYVPENLHNALIDTIVCLRCFLKIRCGYHLSSRKFSLLLQRYVK